MRTLALDQAKTTGYAVFENGLLIESGTFSSKKKDYQEVLIELGERVELLIQEHRITDVVIEDVQLMRNIQSLKKLSQLQGVLYLVCHKNGTFCTTIAPTTWRKVLNTKAKKRVELKQVAIEFVFNYYQKKVKDDEADAICLGHYFIESKHDKHSKKEL